MAHRTKGIKRVWLETYDLDGKKIIFNYEKIMPEVFRITVGTQKYFIDLVEFIEEFTDSMTNNEPFFVLSDDSGKEIIAKIKADIDSPVLIFLQEAEKFDKS